VSLAVLVGLPLAWLAGAQEPALSGESFALLRGLSASRALHFSVPSGPCTEAARRLAAGLGGRFEVSFAPERRDPEAVRFLVGAPTDPEILPCAEACGVAPVVGGFRLLGRDYARPGDALVAVLSDPLRAGRPLVFVLGNDLELVSAYLDEIPRLTRPHLWVHAEGELALECPLAPDGRPRAEEARDYLAARARYFEGGRKSDEPGLKVHLRESVKRERWREYGVALGRVQRRVARWFGAAEPPECELFLYAHLEDFEACLGTSALALVNRLRPRVHVLLAPGLPDDGGAGLARVLARTLGGAPAAQWLEDGLALAAAETWWWQPLDAWAAHLAEGKLLPGVNELFEPEAGERHSEHALVPGRAILFRQAVHGADAREVRSLWKGAALEPQRRSILYQRAIRELTLTSRPGRGQGAKGANAKAPKEKAPKEKAADGKGANPKAANPEGANPKGANPKAANPKGTGKVGKEVAAGARERAGFDGAPDPSARPEGAARPQTGERPGAAERSQARERHPKPAAFRGGLALVEDERAGYGSRAADEAIAALAALEPRPDALSLTVFATTEDPLAPLAPARVRAVHGSASDLALASAASAARAAGLAHLLSLEVLARPGGAWADVLSWTGGDEQNQFWERYARSALHYALLAELLELEYFSFGSNLRDSARTEGPLEERNPELAALRRANWRSLIARLQAAYGGRLVFTARSPAEAEELAFLEELDAIGLFLYPRGLSAAPSEDELRRVLRFELQKAIDLGVRWNKPLLLVQVGFPARADSWSNPLAPRGALDLGAQRRYFEALADVLGQRLENGASLRGFFLWNWPCDPGRAGELDAGFSLRGKPVESALRRLFVR
jgi:hypothetical protein